MNAADEVIDAGSERSGLSGIAVISDHDQYSYAQLNSLINQFGNAMKSRGIGRDNRILFMLDDSVELVAAYLAAMRIGAVSVAYNLRATCADLKYVLEESCAVLFFVDQALSPLYAEIKDDLNNLPAVVVNGAENNNHLSMEGVHSRPGGGPGDTAHVA